jgi:hypothetical protein
MKLDATAVLICATFTLLTACGDNGDDEAQQPRTASTPTVRSTANRRGPLA